jgi:hypothetical protein
VALTSTIGEKQLCTTLTDDSHFKALDGKPSPEICRQPEKTLGSVYGISVLEEMSRKTEQKWSRGACIGSQSFQKFTPRFLNPSHKASLPAQ